MTFDLWDVEAGFYFGRFDGITSALDFVRGLLGANGDDYADVLELGSVDDTTGNLHLSGAALVERARGHDSVPGTGEVPNATHSVR